ncbi:hypothetical protein [Actinoplanes sp. GCM10030250]|uniref:hypothetical protein n=1 Tax=Actinoplanes sp. GCM10030250 TaxID=3273376 RepID=UPI0036227451
MLLLVMLLAVALLPFAIAFQLTSLAHSVYRNRLWLLRDRITDDLRRGNVGRSDSAGQIKEIVDRQIHIVGRHTLADSLIAINVFEVAGDTSVFDDILQDGTPDDDRATLIGYLEDFQHATSSHLKWGSVFGWFISGVFGVAVFAASMIRRVLRGFGTSADPNHVDLSGEVEGGNGEGGNGEIGSGEFGRGGDRVPGRREERRRRPGIGRRRAKTAVEQVAQELRHKVERAEVEIMPAAAPARPASPAARAEVLAGR